MPEATPLSQDQVRKILKREMVRFFTRLRSAAPGWNPVPDQVFIDALADSLLDAAMHTAPNNTMGVAFLQTLIHEMQDRVNAELSKKD